MSRRALNYAQNKNITLFSNFFKIVKKWKNFLIKIFLYNLDRLKLGKKVNKIQDERTLAYPDIAPLYMTVLRWIN